MPVPSRPISPSPTDNPMNDERRLPPLTTQLADYFRRSRPKTPPRTPETAGPSLGKRKFSFSRDEESGSEVQGRPKRSMTEASSASGSNAVGQWARPNSAYDKPAVTQSASLDYATQGFHPPQRNSIAAPPTIEYRPQPTKYEPISPRTIVSQPVENSKVSSPDGQWQRDHNLFTLPSPSKPTAAGEPERKPSLPSLSRPFESNKPQPVHIGESHSTSLPPIQKPQLNQSFQFPDTEASTRGAQYVRGNQHVELWRSSAPNKEPDTTPRETRTHEQPPYPPSTASSSHSSYNHVGNHRWRLDTNIYRPQSHQDDSPRSPRDRQNHRPYEPVSSGPISASTDHSHSTSFSGPHSSVSRYGHTGPTSAASPSTSSNPARKDSLLSESPQLLRYAPAGTPHHQQPVSHAYHARGYDTPRHPDYLGPPPQLGLSIPGPSESPHYPNQYHHHHSHPHRYHEHESPTTPRRAGEVRKYEWEVPGMTGDQVHRKRRGNLPKESTSILNAWFAQHTAYPYPKEEEKQRLQVQTGLTMSQISNWFINARRRRRPSISAANDETWMRSPTSGRRRARS